MAHRHFKVGSGVFTCAVCKRKTRMTTQNLDGEYCGPCEELFGIQNALWDDGEATFVKDGGVPYRDNLLAKIAKAKGDVEAVKAAMPALFKVAA